LNEGLVGMSRQQGIEAAATPAKTRFRVEFSVDSPRTINHEHLHVTDLDADMQNGNRQRERSAGVP
jgi:hypothetical protein